MTDLQIHLQLALEAAHMATWEARLKRGNIIDGDIDWSASGAALLGLPAQALTQSMRQFLRCVHLDDRIHVKAVMQDGIERRVCCEFEFRILWPDGTLHWIAARVRGLYGADGAPQRVLGVIRDISERIRNEILVAERKELAELTLGSIGDGVITTDANGKTQYLNRIAEQLTGWSNKLAHGLDIGTTLKLVDDISGAPLENMVVQCLRLKQAIGISRHSHLITHEGRRIAVEVSAVPIRSGSGDIAGAVAVLHDVSHERKLTRQISWQKTHDTLTGLINRREFENRLAAALASAKKQGEVHALLYLDLDQFKVINDTCGHEAGDVLLQRLSRLLQMQMRDDDILARLGGDELGILLPDCQPGQALSIAEQIRQSIKDFRFMWNERSFELGASIGLVHIDKNGKSMTELLIAADEACYMAKEQGRNRIHVYQGSDLMLAQRRGEMLWVARLSDAFEQSHFKLYAMPIVKLNPPAELHDEVLIRIQSKKGELILPAAFIPAAERYDLMVSIDRWVIKAVCFHVKSMRDSLPQLDASEESRHHALALYSINLSGMSLGDPALQNYITEQFFEYDIAPEQICFEITETAAITNLQGAQEFMTRLKALGCRFSLDDFGSGLSSFAYLKALPVDYLKIDGVFIRDIAINPINHAMVKAINEVGHVMGILTVAEYVEDDATLAIVRALGIDYAQGYAVGKQRPLAAGAA
ncbi:MAG: diguanylate cyclase (GGDEF)-like protein/PAS domain S-box-containing protein [Janthinobacterium sp.]|jgi:diguanylate cyclase (GGDEF)-like protein/PAS domain S-box-containing protein